MAATQEEIVAGLAEIVNEIAGIPVEDVQLDKSFTDDLDVDSLSMVEVVVAAEEKFGVSIPDDEVKNLRTVGDAVRYLKEAEPNLLFVHLGEPDYAGHRHGWMSRKYGAAVRAAGTACGSNNVAVIIPCHRAQRSDGSMGGYAYGVDRKQVLRRREGVAE